MGGRQVPHFSLVISAINYYLHYITLHLDGYYWYTIIIAARTESCPSLRAQRRRRGEQSPHLLGLPCIRLLSNNTIINAALWPLIHHTQPRRKYINNSLLTIRLTKCRSLCGCENNGKLQYDNVAILLLRDLWTPPTSEAPRCAEHHCHFSNFPSGSSDCSDNRVTLQH